MIPLFGWVFVFFGCLPSPPFNRSWWFVHSPALFTIVLVSRLDLAFVVILDLLLFVPYRISEHGRHLSVRSPICALHLAGSKCCNLLDVRFLRGSRVSGVLATDRSHVRDGDRQDVETRIDSGTAHR